MHVIPTAGRISVKSQIRCKVGPCFDLTCFIFMHNTFDRLTHDSCWQLDTCRVEQVLDTVITLHLTRVLPRVCTHLVEAGGLTRVVAVVRHLDGGQVQPRHGVGGRVRQRAQTSREVHQHLQRGRSRAVNGTSRNFIVTREVPSLLEPSPWWKCQLVLLQLRIF